MDSNIIDINKKDSQNNSYYSIKKSLNETANKSIDLNSTNKQNSPIKTIYKRHVFNEKDKQEVKEFISTEYIDTTLKATKDDDSSI